MESELVEIYGQISKIGLPVVFAYGLWRGWWYLKPHVDMILVRVTELTADLKESRTQTERATALAEESHTIAIEALTEARQNREVLEDLRLDLGRLVRALKEE